MLVTAVGISSSGGKIQELLNEAQNEMTPLQEKLKDVAILIGKVGVASGIVTFIGLAIRWGISYAMGEPVFSTCGNNTNAQTSTIARFANLAEDFVVAITIVVVAVPEGLPLAVTLALSLSMFKMMRDKCFVRHLDASETMGQATTICTDKTGTLTYNRMSVVRLAVRDHIYKGEGSGDKDAMPFSARTLTPFMKTVITEGCCINSNCFIKNEEQVDDAGAVPIFVGSATEGAMLIMCKKFGVSYTQVREKLRVIPNGVWSFSAERKRMSTMVVQESGKYRLYSKGASEIIFGLCTHILDPETMKPTPITSNDTSNTQKLIKTWASEGLRTISLAYRDYDHPIDNNTENPEGNMVFIALLAIKDPIRKEIPGAVATCQKAGIVVRMVTGDNILTATKIAKEANIFHGDGIAMEGPVFRKMSRDEKMNIIPRLQVLARCSPSDKHDLVSMLQEMGEVVAVTGDGTNDAPALKQADIGFSMGVCGTQVAMNASDIVLLDDNFTSIVSATRWGRNVLNTIRKFLQFQLGINCAAIIVTFVGSIATGHSPLSTIQLLLVNLIMDSLGALALASDEPDHDILNMPPQRKTDFVITPIMWEYIGLQTFYQTASILLVLFGMDSWLPVDKTFHTEAYDYSTYPSNRSNTMVFTTFIFMQITNLISARNLNGELNMFARFFTNKLFLFVIVAITAIMVIAITVAYQGFNATKLSAFEWLVCIIIAIINIPLTFIFRLCSRLIKENRKTNQVKKVGVDKETNIHADKTTVIQKSTEELGPLKNSRPLLNENPASRHGSRRKRDIEAGEVSGSHGNLSRQSSVVEVFRKIKVDNPMPTKAQSLTSLHSRKSIKEAREAAKQE